MLDAAVTANHPADTWESRLSTNPAWTRFQERAAARAAVEIHSPNTWEGFLSTQPEWLKFTSEEHAAANAIVAQKPGWGGWPLVLSGAVVTAALVWLFVELAL